MSKRKALTPKQQAFCREVAAGNSLADSYRAAYSAANMTKATIRNEASDLMADPRISMTVESIRERIETASVSAALSDGERVKDILRDLAVSAEPQDMARLRACELLGRTVGLFKDVTETIDTRSAADVRVQLAARLAEYADSTDTDDTPCIEEPVPVENDDDPVIVH